MFVTLLAAAALTLPVQPPANGPTRRPGPIDDDVIRQLVDGLKDPDFEVRQNLAAALAKTGVRTLPPLREALKDRLAERRSGAAYALGLLGEAARPALPELLEALNDPETDVRRQASFAVGRVIPAGRAPAPPADTAARPAVLPDGVTR